MSLMDNLGVKEVAFRVNDEKNDELKVVLLSGPSSSGKTTTAKKLALYLKTLGLREITLHTEYFNSALKGYKDYE